MKIKIFELELLIRKEGIQYIVLWLLLFFFKINLKFNPLHFSEINTYWDFDYVEQSCKE